MNINNTLGSDVMRVGCVIGLPTVGHHGWRFTNSLVAETHPLNFTYTYYWVEGLGVADAYNAIFHYAKQQGAEFLLTREEDTIAPRHAWVRLVNRMRYNPDIFAISAIYPRKDGGDPTPFLYRGNGHGAYLDWKWGEFFEVTGLPFGCTLIRMSMLKQLDPLVGEVTIKNWPTRGKETVVKEYCREDKWVDENGVERSITQDLYFCGKAQDAGLKLFADASINCQHHDLQNGLLYQVPYQLHDVDYDVDKSGKKAINLGAGSQSDYIHGVKPIRVDLREDVEPDLRMDLRDLSGLEDGAFDYVYSSHTLEHFTDEESHKILSEMVRICKPGGEVHIVVPSLLGALKKLYEGNDEPYTWWMIYGAQGADWNFHKTGFTPKRFNEWLTGLGMKGIIAASPEELIVRAFKPPLPSWYEQFYAMDRSTWSKDRFLNYDVEEQPKRHIRVGSLLLPVADDVPQEDIDAYFTPATRSEEERHVSPPA